MIAGHLWRSMIIRNTIHAHAQFGQSIFSRVSFCFCLVWSLLQLASHDFLGHNEKTRFSWGGSVFAYSLCRSFGLGVFSASLLELVNFRRFLLKHPIGTESVLNPCLPAVPHQQIARPRHSSVRRAAPPSLALSRQVWKLGGLVDMQGGPQQKTNITPTWTLDGKKTSTLAYELRIFDVNTFPCSKVIGENMISTTSSWEVQIPLPAGLPWLPPTT